LSTFELADFVVGTQVVEVPAGLYAYSTTVDMLPQGTDMLVRVDAELDFATRTVTWTFTSIDPATAEPTTDPLAGFLPPNNAQGHGEGSVGYRVRPMAGLATGAQIRNAASIKFDDNPVIVTNETLNTIDSAAPASQVNSPPTTSTRSFLVSWSGADNAGGSAGSGIAVYDVFVSTDGGPFTRWLNDTTATSATYTGAVGHTYAFYSVATDNVGHVESPPTIADATTSIVEPGDYDHDGTVASGDYLVWRASFGQTGVGLAADGNQDGLVDAADYAIWREHAWRIVQDSQGDYNRDGLINNHDYRLWRSTFGQVGQNLAADGNHDGVVDAADYAIWRSRNQSIVLLTLATAGFVADDADKDWSTSFEHLGSSPVLSLESDLVDEAFADLASFGLDFGC
jgi:hypothetical protein